MDDATVFERLITDCNYALDRRNYDAVRRLYHPDAVEDHGGYVGGIEGFIIWAEQTFKTIASSAHIVTDVRVAILGDYAESESRGTNYLRLNGTPPSNVLVVGRHFDRFERRDGEWRFIHRSLCVDWANVFVPETASLAVVDAVDVGRPNRTDPFYRRLELLPSRVDAGNTSQT